MPDPRYLYDRDQHTYYKVRATAKVPWAEVSRRLYDSLDDLEEQGASLAWHLRDGRITLQQYETGMMQLIKRSHLVNSTLAKGGWNQMSQADFGRVGGHVGAQYRYLRARVQAIKNGTQPVDGRLANISRQYVRMSRRTFSKTMGEEMEERGYDKERRVLSKFADHCRTKERPGCVDIASRGWQPIGTLPLIGEAQCLGGCRCRFEYRNSRTKAVLR